MKSTLTFCMLLFMSAAAHAQKDITPIIYAPKVVRQYDSTSIRVQAQFPGGTQGWVSYLQRNLRAEVGGDNIVLRRHQKDSIETVIVSFLVDTAGNISETKVENPLQVNPAVGAEAVRVIQNGPKWVPATINGVKVIYRQKQSISFEVAQG